MVPQNNCLWYTGIGVPCVASFGIDNIWWMPYQADLRPVQDVLRVRLWFAGCSICR